MSIPPIDPTRSTGSSSFGDSSSPAMNDFKKEMKKFIDEMRDLPVDQLISRLHEILAKADLVNDNSVEFQDLKTLLRGLNESAELMNELEQLKGDEFMKKLEMLEQMLRVVLSHIALNPPSGNPEIQDFKEGLNNLLHPSPADKRDPKKQLRDLLDKVEKMDNNSPEFERALNILQDLDRKSNSRIDAEDREFALITALSEISYL